MPVNHYGQEYGSGMIRSAVNDRLGNERNPGSVQSSPDSQAGMKRCGVGVIRESDEDYSAPEGSQKGVSASNWQ